MRQEHIVEDGETKAGREYERKGGDDAETFAGQAKDKIDVGSLRNTVLPSLPRRPDHVPYDSEIQFDS